MQTDPESKPLWQQDESLREVVARLDPRPADLQLVSFDFFDTLVCRLCAEPSELFIEVGRRLARDQQLLFPLTPDEFRAARIAADERARKQAIERGTLGEVKLTDIYAELKNVVRSPAAARDIEFEIERTFCYLNPALASLVQHVRSLGYKTAVVSDTYFTAAELQRLLRENGGDPALFDAVLVSCERGAAKWNGALYQELFRQFNLHPNEVLHLGDNVHADIQAAGRIRVEAVHYYKTTPALDAIFKSERTLRGTQSLPAAALNSLRVLTARRARSNEDAFRDGALAFGPVLARYADWCVQKFTTSGVTTVLALMREGEVLGELLENAAASAGVKFAVVPCFASRFSTARAAMPEVTPDRAMELLGGGGVGLTPRTVLEILGLGAEAGQLMDAAALSKALGSPEQVRGLLKLLFKLPKLRQLIETKRAQSHELAFAYFASLIGDDEQVGVVDLGWSGSIQRNIARILRRGGREIRTLGCYLACTPRAGRLALEGDAAHGFLDHNWDRMTILPEVAITSAVGSTNSYARNAAGQVQPVLGEYSISPAERQTKQRLHDGIIAFQSAWLALWKHKGRNTFSPEMLADLDSQCASIFYRLLEFPTKPEADRLGVLTHDENYFGENLSAPLCDDTSPERLRRAGLSSLFQNTRCYWPQGVAARCHPRLVSVLRAGWSDPLALGRLGAWNGGHKTDSGITHDEIVHLSALLRAFAPDQVVFAGNFTDSLEEAFAGLWETSTEATAGVAKLNQLILFNHNGGEQPGEDLPFSHASVTGNPADVRTLRALRSHLKPGAQIALVIPSDMPAERAEALLHGLAPFLGERGLIFAAWGRFDRPNVGADAPSIGAMNRWAKSHAAELGYGLWGGNQSSRSAQRDWQIYRRDAESFFWNRQWMLNPEEFAHAPCAAA